MPAYIFDVEATSLSMSADIHCLVAEDEQSDERFDLTDKDTMKEFLSQDDLTLIGHNITDYDIPLLESYLGMKVKCKIVDTLFFSWVLWPKRLRHGLKFWGEDLGVKKPEIEDWEGLSLEEYLHRCQEDVKINKKLWAKICDYLMRLYGSQEAAERYIDYLAFKAECVKLQSESKWKLDIKKAAGLKEYLEALKEPAYKELQGAMPKVPKYEEKARPKRMYRKDGSLTSYGDKWVALCREHGKPDHYSKPIRYVKGYEDPNPDSPEQVKNWLLGLGWKPCTHKFKREEDGTYREIPQVRVPNSGGLLTPSVEALAEKDERVKSLAGYSILQHRIGIVAGFLRDGDDEGYLTARMQGLTNTLRLQHKELVNLPAPDKPYGKEIRGCLIAPEGMELCGSDKTALEDRTKQHYMWKHDPEYVKTMMEDGYCPHVDIAYLAGFLTEEEVERHKTGNFLDKADEKHIKAQRKKAKPVNYGGTYGQKAKGLSRSAGMPLDQAKKLTEIYEQRNWSLEAIAKEQIVKVVDGQKWLYNPVSQFWYTLRNEKDRFSTLNQGTGVYCFDTWIKHILKRRRQLTGQFHDEIILTINKGKQELCERLLRDALKDANDELKLNRELDIDVQFGESYAEIH